VGVFLAKMTRPRKTTRFNAQTALPLVELDGDLVGNADEDKSGQVDSVSLRILNGDSLSVLPTIPAESVQCCVTSPPYWGLKDRDLMGLPWRVAFAMQADGWILRSRITWIKKTAMPESVKNRPTTATEEVFLFAKSPNYFCDPNGVREASGANLRNYWVLGPDCSNNGHPAAFPRELAKRCILLGSRASDTVLDPFGGSGTTGIAAKELGRNAVLIELNPEFAELSRKRAQNGEEKKFQATHS
jgi:DNA modification methylase